MKRSSTPFPGLALATFLLTPFLHPVAATEAGRTLEQEAVIPAEVAKVWEAFTSAEGMMPWMQLKAAEVDLRVGGTIRTSYTEESLDGDSTIVQRILSFEPERMISLRVEKSPAENQFPQLKDTWAVMYFESLSPQETRVRIVGLGYGEGPEWDRVYDFFERANPMVFTALKQHFSPDPETGEPGDED